MDPERLSTVCRAHGVRLLLQSDRPCPSRRTGQRSRLAVLLDRRPASLGAYGALASDFQALVSDRDVDLVLNGSDPLFLKQITDQCRLLYGATRALDELTIRAFKRYQDRRRFLATERVCVRDKIRALAR
jgi:hypothetical protein